MRNRTDLIKYKNLLNTYIDSEEYSVESILNQIQEYLSNNKDSRTDIEQKIDFVKYLFSLESCYLKIYSNDKFFGEILDQNVLIIFNSQGDIWCLINIEGRWNELDLINLEMKEFNISKIRKVYKKLIITTPIDNSKNLLTHLDDLIHLFLFDNQINELADIIDILNIIGKDIFKHIFEIYDDYRNTKEFNVLQEKLLMLKEEIGDIKLDKFKIYNEETLSYDNFKSAYDKVINTELIIDDEIKKPEMIITEIPKVVEKPEIIMKEVNMLNDVNEQKFEVRFLKRNHKIFTLNKNQIIVSN